MKTLNAEIKTPLGRDPSNFKAAKKDRLVARNREIIATLRKEGTAAHKQHPGT